MNLCNVSKTAEKKNKTLYMHIFTEYHIHSDKSVRGASQHGCHCSIRQVSLYHMYGVLEAWILLLNGSSIRFFEWSFSSSIGTIAFCSGEFPLTVAICLIE